MRRLYGIHPWEVQRYTLRELEALANDRAKEEVSDGAQP